MMAEQPPQNLAPPGLTSAPRFRLFNLVLLRISGGRELWALSDQALVSGSNFLTNVLFARALGLTGFGVFALCWMVVLLMSTLQGALIISPMMSIGPKQEQYLRPSYFGAVTAQALCLSVCSALCVYLCTLGSALWFPFWHTATLALPLAVATGTYLIQDYTRRYFFTIGRNSMAMACDALSYLTQLPLLWLFAWRKELTISGALWIIGLTSLFSVAVSFFWREELCFTRSMIRIVADRHRAVIVWLAPAAVLQWMSLNLFMVFAPVYYGAQALGGLRACQNLVAVAHIWFLGLENVVPAEAAHQLHEYGIDASLRYIRKTLVRWGLLTFAFMAILSVAPSFWLHLLYGSRYTQFGYVLRLYGLLYLMTFAGGPLRAGLQAIEYTAPLLWSYVAMTAFAGITAAPLAKRLGLLGVMLGLIATQFIFQFILGIALFSRARQIRRQELVALQTKT